MKTFIKINNQETIRAIYGIAEDILCHPDFKKTHQYIHHQNISCYEHAIHVALHVYFISKKLNHDVPSAVRGALLHDFYLYDWHKGRPGNPNKIQLHGFRHPKIALEEANSRFHLNPLEKDIIYRHMWPLTFFRFPCKKETFWVTSLDKYCSIIETISKKRRNQIKNYVKKNFPL